MATRTRNLNVTVGADVKPFKRAIDSADRSLDKFAKQTSIRGRVMAGGMKSVGVAATGATAAIGGLAAGGVYLIKQYEESAKVARQTNAVIKSTGGEAGVTAKHVDALATAISRKTGMDDEAVASAQNVLLTFTKVRNETGEGNKVFDRATQVIADMSAALGQDLKGSTIQVGKALNDPIKGITALTRVGVTFDEKQKQTIKRLVESGKTMDAQKVILRELNKEFGGSAAAAATPFDKLKVSVGNVAETIGGALAPKAEEAASKLNKFVIQMQDGTGAGGRFVDTLEDIKDDVQPIVEDFAKAASAVARFTSKHPEIVKVAGAVVGVGVALKALSFASSVTGFTNLLKASKVAATGIKRVLAGAGTSGGAAVSANAAETLATNASASLNARKGRIRSAFTSVFRSAGTSAGATASATAAETAASNIDKSVNARKGKFTTAGKSLGAFLGAAAGPVAIAAVGTAIALYLSKLNDQLEKKGGAPGAIGWLSNLGEDIIKLAAPGGRTGGRMGSFAGGGRIPGVPVAADSVPALLSPQEFVVTGDGERTLEGMTFPGVLDWLQGAQAPHFRSGGRAPRRMRSGGFVSTSYGPPWNAMNGTGVTRTGVNLKGRPHIYGMAVDPSVIPLGAKRYVNPNPFGYDGTFRAFDTGGAIKGNRIDFYDWRGRAKQNGWGRRNVTVSTTRQGGGSSAGPPGPALGSQFGTGYAAGLEGSSIKGVLGAALGYVGEPHKKASATLSSTGGGAPAGAPSAVTAMLSRAKSIAGKGLPYTYGGGHGGFGNGTPGFDCSGYVSAILGPNALSSPMAVREPMASALQRGAGEFVTVGIRGSSGKQAHTMVKIGNQYFESGGGHGPAKTGGWNGSFEKFHPRGLRRGGRARMRLGGRLPGGFRSRGRGSGRVASLLDRIRRGSTTTVRSALKQLQPLLADRGNFSNLKAWISAANRRGEGSGVTSAGRRGLTAFVALAQAEYGRQLGEGVAAVDAGEAGFDQADTDLSNRLIISGATEAQTAQAQIGQGFGQLTTMLNDRRTLAGLLGRARRTGDKKLTRTLTERLGAQDSAILSKQAGIVQLQRSVSEGAPTQEDILNMHAAQAALTGDTADDTAANAAMLDFRQGKYLQALQGGDPRVIAQAAQDLKSAMDANTQAQQDVNEGLKAHAEAIKALADETKRNNDIALSTIGSNAAQSIRAVGDLISGELGGRTRNRSYTAGTGTAYAF